MEAARRFSWESRAIVENSYPARAAQELREDFLQTYPLSASGRISLENLNGGVRIAVWDRGEFR